MQRLPKQLLSALRAAFPFPASYLHHHHLLSASAVTAAAATKSPTRFVAEDYLVASCGLTEAQAARASRRLQYIKSPSNVDSVCAFLADLGLSKADIAAAISRYPAFLHCKVDETLTSQVARLREIGLSTTDIGRLITVAPNIASNPRTISRVEFYLSFLGSYTKLHTALKNNSSLLSRNNIESVVKPNIAFLQQCGVTTCDIANILMVGSRLVITDPERVKGIVACADKFGVPRESACFKYALIAIGSMNPLRISTKLDFFKKALGCSDAEVGTAVSKLPLILKYSDAKLSHSLKFLKAEVGLETQYIVHRPALLSYSFGRRLMPRYHVLKILKEKGLLKEDTDFYYVVSRAEDKFIEKFLLPYEGRVPGLAEAYAAACAGKMLPEI